MPDIANHSGFQLDPDDLTAVVDTNVVLDVFSTHDLSREYEDIGITGLTSLDATYRRARARESLLFAIFLNEIGASTYSLHSELLAKIQDCVDPSAQDSLETHVTTSVTHFVKPYLLDRWKGCIAPGPDELSKTDADRELVRFATEHGLPLITNEGFGPHGVSNIKLRKRAQKAGVDVFTPRQFYDGKLEENVAIEGFLSAFREARPEYLAKHPKPQIASTSLDVLFGLYHHVLLGETNGVKNPLPVTLPEPK